MPALDEDLKTKNNLATLLPQEHAEDGSNHPSGTAPKYQMESSPQGIRSGQPAPPVTSMVMRTSERAPDLSLDTLI